MMYSKLELRAVAFAYEAHMGQERKYTGEPYVVHPIAVAAILRKVVGCADQELLAAALLHDVVEDTKYTFGDLRVHFPARVVSLVAEVTELKGVAARLKAPGVYPAASGNRAERKAAERERLRGVSEDAKTLKLADLIDNTASITARAPDFVQVYMGEKRLLLEDLIGGNETLHGMATEHVIAYYGHLPPMVGDRVEYPELYEHIYYKLTSLEGLVGNIFATVKLQNCSSVSVPSCSVNHPSYADLKYRPDERVSLSARFKGLRKNYTMCSMLGGIYTPVSLKDGWVEGEWLAESVCIKVEPHRAED